MPMEHRFTSVSNVVSFAEARQRRLLQQRPAVDRMLPAAGDQAIREMVLFITGGSFECMVNGVVALLEPGDFVRVPRHGACSIRDVGPVPGSVVSHSFSPGLDSRFLRELAEALPPHSSSIPRANSRAFARLAAIAKRWGVTLDCGAAA